jgi:putative salt-induced outer membrane protein YdiY
MNTKLIALVIILNLTMSTFAQVNTEKYRKMKDEFGFYGTAAVELDINTGNNDKQEIGLESYLNYNAEKSLTLLILKGTYGFVNGKDYSDDALAHLRYLYKLSPSLNFEIFGQYDFDKNRLLLDRELLGGGVRLIASESDSIKMWFGLSYFYEYEKYDLNNSSVHPPENYSNRISSYITFRLNINENLKLASVVYFQPKIGEWEDLRILNDNSLLVEIAKHIGISIEFNLRLDKRPPDTIKELDTKTKVGITYRF